MSVLAGTEDHPQARMVLTTALEQDPSHAYLFHGPAGTGKRTAARAFAAELLAEGADDPDGVRRRVAHGSHPDLTWVRPTGAHVKRTEDVVKIGDMIWVKCIGIDDKGRVKLSRKAALKERAEKETGQAL